MAIEKINNIELYFDPKVDSRVKIMKRVLAAYEKNKIFFDYSFNEQALCSYYLQQARDE